MAKRVFLTEVYQPCISASGSPRLSDLKRFLFSLFVTRKSLCLGIRSIESVFLSISSLPTDSLSASW